MKTDARIVETARGKRVQVETPNWTDWPILYPDGTVAYDAPEKIPAFIKPKVVRLLKQVKDLPKEKTPTFSQLVPNVFTCPVCGTKSNASLCPRLSCRRKEE